MDRIVKTTEEAQKQILRKFVNLPIGSKLEIMKLNRNIFYKFREKHQDVSMEILSYASLLKAIEKFCEKQPELDLNIVKMRSKTVKKQPKQDRLLDRWALIKELKSKNLSYREVSKYLKKYHKLDVAHSTIYAMWQELENNNKEK